MSSGEYVKGPRYGLAKVLWILFFTFALYLCITLFLVLVHETGIRFTLIFEDALGNLLGAMLVFFYLVVGLLTTRYLYRRTLRTPAVEAYVYAMAAVIVGVAAPYIYALLMSFMGIMRDILPLLFIGLFYVAGILVGLRIIPDLTGHLTSE